MANGGDRSRIGAFYWIFQASLVLVIAGVLHLGVVQLDVLFNLIIFAMLGIMLTVLAVLFRGGQIVSASFGPRTVVATICGFGILVFVNLGMWYFFGAPLFSSVSGSGQWAERALVNILAAICEEDLFFGVYCVMKTANLPDVWIIFLSSLVFVVLHVMNVLYASLSLPIVIFLSVGRAVLSGLYAVTDHSDPSFIVHVLWNVLNS